MKHLKVMPSAIEAIKKYTLPQQKELGFGQVMAPIMITAEYENGKWGELRMVEYGPLSMAPTAKVFHYGQEIFEGMKAYRYQGEGPYLFRPDENLDRFNKSSVRMAMPEIPEEYFMESVHALTGYCADFIPKRSGESLYIRPFTIATQENLGIKPSEKYLFCVIASPSGAYFSKSSVPVMVERNAARACPGGIGNAKTGGNYSASLISAFDAKKAGYLMTIWLDALEKKYIEELSGMNFFCVINDVLYTPELTDTILVGITRKSLIVLARRLGIEVREEKLAINDLQKKIEAGECTECFACGTAAIVSPIECLGEFEGKRYMLKHPQGPIATKLRDELLGVQEGRIEAPEGWIQTVEVTTL